MSYPNIARPTYNHVRAVFDLHAVFFDIPPAATFGSLAASLAHLRDRHEGTLKSVIVRVGHEADEPTPPATAYRH